MKQHSRAFGPRGEQIMARLMVVMLMMALLNCRHASRDAVNVIAAQGDQQRLAGQWRGTYESKDLGRSGAIIFTLTGDEAGASGEVMMHSPHVPAIPLRIEFVRVTQDQISGVIERYPDPDGSGTLETHFVGRWIGDVIEGGFVTYSSEGGSPRSGIWKVKRSGSQ